MIDAGVKFGMSPQLFLGKVYMLCLLYVISMTVYSVIQLFTETMYYDLSLTGYAYIMITYIFSALGIPNQ